MHVTLAAPGRTLPRRSEEITRIIKGGTYGEEARMARNVGDAADDGSGGIGTIDSGPAEGQPKSRGKAADRGDRHHGELRPAAGEGTQSLGWTGAVWESVARRRR